MQIEQCSMLVELHIPQKTRRNYSRECKHYVIINDQEILIRRNENSITVCNCFSHPFDISRHRACHIRSVSLVFHNITAFIFFAMHPCKQESYDHEIILFRSLIHHVLCQILRLISLKLQF